MKIHGFRGSLQLHTSLPSSYSLVEKSGIEFINNVARKVTSVQYFTRRSKSRFGYMEENWNFWRSLMDRVDNFTNHHF